MINRGCAGENNTVRDDGFTGKNAENITHPDIIRRNNFFSTITDNTCRLGREINQFFNTGTRFGNSPFLKIRSYLHDDRNFCRGKCFADEDGSNQCNGYKNVGPDVKTGHKTDNRLNDNGNTTEDDSNPSGINWEIVSPEETDQNSSSR